MDPVTIAQLVQIGVLLGVKVIATFRSNDGSTTTLEYSAGITKVNDETQAKIDNLLKEIKGK
jgi:hypothetical protein